MRRILSLAAVASAVHAQSGLVKSANQPIPGATVTIRQGDSKVLTTTDANGRYTLPPVAKGAWTIEVTMFGFEPAQAQVNDPEPAQRLDFNLTLKESPVRARLKRSGGGVGKNRNHLEPQIGTEANGINQSEDWSGTDGEINNETFLVSGSLSQGLTAGAPPDSGPAQQGPGLGNGPPGQAAGAQAPQAPIARGSGGSRPAGRGGRPGAGAQFGNRHPRSQIWGMMFATLDNSALNAKPFSITGQDISQPAYAQARFGVVLGGPLTIPILGHKSAFFSLSYFATRARNPYTAVETVPFASERLGDFSQALESGRPVALYDPTTQQPFSGNVIPPNRIDRIAQKLLGYVPLPNQPGAVNNFEFQTSVPQNTDNFGARVMRNIGTKDWFSYNLAYQRRDSGAAQPFGFLDATSGYGIQTDITWTHNFTPATISTTRMDFNRNRNQITPHFAYGPDVAAELGIAGASPNPLAYGPPNLNFTNFGSLSDANPVLTRNQRQKFAESLILSRGNHKVTFGMQYGRNDLSTQTEQNGRGTLNFTGQGTSLLGPHDVPVAGTGFDFADFLLGLPQSSSIQYGSSSMYFTQNVWSGYVVDDWKVKSNLTLKLGLRYDFFAPLREKHGHMATLDIAPDYAAVAVVTPGDVGPYSGTFPPGLINPDYNNLAPRVGLAWKVPFVKRSTIVRAGYGIYYNGQAYYPFGARLAQQPPFATSNTVDTSPLNVLTVADSFVAVTPQDITNTFAVDRHYRTPYAQTWNVAIQHDLGRGFFMELGYLGTKGTRLDVRTLPKEGPGGSLLAARHQLGDAIGFTYDSSNGDSIYHAFQAHLMRRFRGGLSMNAHYTFAKSIDDSSTFGGAVNTVAQNWLNLAAERGLSSFDRRQVFDMTWVLTSPFGAPKSAFAESGWPVRLLKDWTLSGGVTAETGLPLTARVLGNTAFLAQTGGIGSGRADATGASVETNAGFFNQAAFAVPPPGQFGDAGRNTIPGPGTVALNAAIGRSFQFGDTRRRLELRLAANNVLNQVNYSNINTVVNAINYGLPISATPMRTLDVVMRFRF